METIAYGDFAKLDIRVGKITEVKRPTMQISFI
jgi:tRNA-binding protein